MTRELKPNLFIIDDPPPRGRVTPEMIEKMRAWYEGRTGIEEIHHES